MANALPKFIQTTYAKYLTKKAADQLDANALYFITDSGAHQIYKGADVYAAALIKVSSEAALPEASAAQEGALYYNTGNNTAKIFVGGAYYDLSIPKATSISGSVASTDNTFPTTYAVQEYAKSVGSAATADKLDKISGTNGNILTVASNGSAIVDSGFVAGTASTIGTASSTVLPNEVAVKDYADSAAAGMGATKLDKISGTNGNLLAVDSTGSAVKDSGLVAGGASIAATPTTSTLATELAVSTAISAAEDRANSYTDSKIEALGDVFEFKGTKANIAALPAGSDSKKGDVWIVTDAGSDADGNPLSNVEYVYDGSDWEMLGTTVNLTGYAEKAVPTAAGEIATLASDGDLVASGKTIGGATITVTSGAASENVLATEKAVKAYADAVASSAAGAYLPFVTSATENDIAFVGANGQTIVDSGLTAGAGTNIATTPVTTVLANELAVKTYADSAAASMGSTKIDKFANTNNHIIFGDGSSQIKDSGYTIGGASISSTGSAVVATEEGVASAVATEGNKKLDKISGTNDHILVVASSGSAVADSGLTADSTSFAATPSSTTLATEAAVADYLSSTIGWQTL